MSVAESMFAVIVVGPVAVTISMGLRVAVRTYFQGAFGPDDVVMCHGGVSD